MLVHRSGGGWPAKRPTRSATWTARLWRPASFGSCAIKAASERCNSGVSGHSAGLGGGDRTLRSGGDDGRDRRRDIGGILEWRQRKTRRAVPARPDQAGNDEPQHGAVAIHRLGERFPRYLAAGAIEQLLDNH